MMFPIVPVESFRAAEAHAHVLVVDPLLHALLLLTGNANGSRRRSRLWLHWEQLFLFILFAYDLYLKFKI
jgi:hypothetical protein